jgi:hypothetical protein
MAQVEKIDLLQIPTVYQRLYTILYMNVIVTAAASSPSTWLSTFVLAVPVLV